MEHCFHFSEDATKREHNKRVNALSERYQFLEKILSKHLKSKEYMHDNSRYYLRNV
jgi:hypothetical protein